MSGLVLTFNRDRAPTDLPVGTRMLTALKHRGPDGSDVVHTPLVLLGHQHFWTTPEEIGEHQPLAESTGRFYLVFDGRLDNRQELLNSLDCHHPQISDAALLLLAYERWAEDCFTRLVGPFAAALFDATRRRVVCARDALGDRTLFYFLNAHVLVVASEEQAVLTHPAVARRIDEHRLAACFALQVPADGSTFFTGIAELLPAHVLVVGEENVQTRHYWTANPTAQLRYRSDAEYAEHFQALLADSVACRLRAPSPPAVMMSGGLDSTSVAALAARRLQMHPTPARLRTVSYVFDELQSCDERWFMAAMADWYKLETVQICGDDAWPLCDADTWPFNPNTPEENLYRRLKERVYQTTRDSGTRVLLTGVFGDELYAGAEYWLWDLLRERRFLQAWCESGSHLQRYGLWDSLKSPALRRLPGIQGLRRLRPTPTPHWLTDYAKAKLPETDPWAELSRAACRPEQYESVLGSYTAQDASGEIFHASRCGIELRHPYRDRRLIEFMLAIPAHQLYSQGLYKHILRNAMKGILPERIRTRHRPTSLMPLFLRGVAEKEVTTIRRLLQRPERMWPQYVRADWLAQAVPGRLPAEAEELIIWLCVCVELWHKQEEGIARKDAVAR